MLLIWSKLQRNWTNCCKLRGGSLTETRLQLIKAVCSLWRPLTVLCQAEEVCTTVSVGSTTNLISRPPSNMSVQTGGSVGTFVTGFPVPFHRTSSSVTQPYSQLAFFSGLTNSSPGFTPAPMLNPMSTLAVYYPVAASERYILYRYFWLFTGKPVFHKHLSFFTRKQAKLSTLKLPFVTQAPVFKAKFNGTKNVCRKKVSLYW